MRKKEYIAKQLGRTFNKKYENYCITRIWHKLDNLDVQIVTQQMFRRGDGKIALADLYFPQLMLGVEIDEGQHEGREKEDQKRIEDLQKRFSEVVDGEKPDFKRIKVYDNDLEDVNKQVDEFVEFVKKRIEDMGDNFKKWTIDTKTFEDYKGTVIKVEDNVKLRTIWEISELFNKHYKKTKNNRRRCIFKLNDNELVKVWCPKLRLDDEDFKGNKIDNRISQDKRYIYETSNDRPFHFWKEALDINEIRITFAQYRDELGKYAYKFMGVYEIDKDKMKEEEKERIECKKDVRNKKNEKNTERRRIWKRISDSVDLKQLK